jgi:hypothetical protein
VAPGELIPLDLDRATLAHSGRREGRAIRFLCPAHEDTQPIGVVALDEEFLVL